MLTTKKKPRKAHKTKDPLDNQNPLELLRSIKAGFPCRVIREFQAQTGLTLEQIAAWTGIHPRTLARRLDKGKLNSDESDRFCRVKRLWNLTLGLYEGQADGAAQWLTSPLQLYGGLTPIELSSTDAGSHELEAIIGRLEDGVF